MIFRCVVSRFAGIAVPDEITAQCLSPVREEPESRTTDRTSRPLGGDDRGRGTGGFRRVRLLRLSLGGRHASSVDSGQGWRCWRPSRYGIVVDPSVVAAPASPTPAAVVAPAVAPSAAPVSTVPPVRPGTAIPGDASRPETGPPARSTAATADQRRSGTEAKDSSSGVAAAAPAAVPRPRTSEAAAGFELQQPRVGPCTEAVAALGLCKREPTQRRE